MKNKMISVATINKNRQSRVCWTVKNVCKFEVKAAPAGKFGKFANYENWKFVKFGNCQISVVLLLLREDP